MLATELMLITLPPSGPKYFIASLDASRTPRTLILNSRWNSSSVTSSSGAKTIDAGVIDEHVERAKGLLCRVKQPLNVGGLRYVGLHRDGLAALAGDFCDDAIRTLPAGGVIHDHRSAHGGEPFRDRRADALRGASHDRHLARQLAHVNSPVLPMFRQLHNHRIAGIQAPRLERPKQPASRAI